MKVSVVVPAYNAAATLGEALDSLIAQTFQDWEAVVVDDGSTDGTAEIARSYGARDPRIRLVVQDNGGESAARNTGVREARCDWLLFLDADDWVAPKHLERMTGALAANPSLDAVLCRSVRVAANGTQVSDNFDPPAGDLFPTLAKRAAFPVHACVVRRALVIGVGLFDTSLRKSPDWDLWQRVARAGASFGSVGEVLAYYRMQPASASLDAEQLLRDGLRVLRRGHEHDPRVPAPASGYANGMPSEGIGSQQYYLLCWCAGLLIGQGRSPVPLFDLLRDAEPVTLYADAIARTLFEAATLPRCLPPTAWEAVWPDAHPRLDEFLPELERRSGTANLAVDVWHELRLAIARHSPISGDAVRRLESSSAELDRLRNTLQRLERSPLVRLGRALGLIRAPRGNGS